MSGVAVFTIALGLRLLLGATFAASALSKIRAPKKFLRAISLYGLVPRRLLGVVTTALIGAESVAALTLLSGVAMTVGVVTAISLLLVFLASVAVNMRRGNRVACGCFGTESDLIGPATVVRIVVLLVVAAAIAATPSTPWSLALTAPWQLIGSAGVSVALALVVTWFARASEIYGLVRAIPRAPALSSQSRRS